jgi:predicted transcriptional regulator
MEIDAIWKEYGSFGEISEEEFWRYFEGCERGSVLTFSRIIEFSVPFDSREVLPNFVPPQNYRCLNEKEASLLMKQSNLTE